MGCRIGMATDVVARVRQLKDEKKVPTFASCRILAKGLTYEEANRKEILARRACGSHCEGQTGGAYKSGKVWSVYRIDWIDKKTATNKPA